MPTQKVDEAHLCEGLRNLVLKKGKLTRHLSGYNVEPDGTYSHGYRLEGTVHELKTKNFTVELTRSRTSLWNLGTDSHQSEEVLRIAYGIRSKYLATKNLGGEFKRFGAGEMYQGIDKIKPEPWKANLGRIPVKLVANYLQRNLKKKIPKEQS